MSDKVKEVFLYITIITVLVFYVVARIQHPNAKLPIEFTEK